jgi:hypothetical protein
LDGRICVIGFVRVAGQEPVLDALLYNETSEIGCSGRVFGVLRKPSDELVTPSCRRGTGEVRSWVECTSGRYQSQRPIVVPECRQVTSHD